MLIDTDKYYCLVYTDKTKKIPVMNKYQIWNNLSTAIKNHKQHQSIQHWENLKILEFDIANPSKSRFVKGD